MKISTFYDTDYVNYSSYDNLRKVASAIDGQKNAARKIIYTMLEKNIKTEIKVSQLGSKVSEFAEYLHGNMDGVIVNLAKNFAGTNNLPLLTREGNFGTRFSPQASASRYIYTFGSENLWNLFIKADNDILDKQYFEGVEIEPKFYVPNLPILLINGSEGVSSGFAQKILPRDPAKIAKYVKDSISDELRPQSANALTPYFEGFNGVIEQGDNPAQWLIKGTINRKTTTKVEITEVPVGYDLKSYIKVLDDLEDDKVIYSYKDKSENDKFLFEISMSVKDLKTLSDDQLLVKFKLVKKVTELYTSMDRDNKIKVFNNAKEIIDYFIDVKLDYLVKRKTYQLYMMEKEIKLDFSKYLFIKSIVDDKLIINKRKKTDIVNDLSGIENIIEKEGSYDYLLGMNIMSLTEERLRKLQDDIKRKKADRDVLDSKTIQEIWLNEL